MKDRNKLATALITAAALQQSSESVNIDLGRDVYDLSEMPKILPFSVPKRKQKQRTAQTKKQRIKNKQSRKARKQNQK